VTTLLLGLAGYQWSVSRDRQKQLSALSQAQSDVIAQLQEALEAQRSSDPAAPASALEQTVDESIAKLRTFTITETIPARIYVHIGDESQRDAAAAFQTQLTRLGGGDLALPGIELRADQRNEGVLRCFRPEECRDEAPKLLEDANRLLESPKLKLQDLSERYKDAKLRPRHYEIWFGKGPLQLAEPAIPAAKPKG
jgi:type II secretory pathway pseudopilin PulG